VTYDDDVTLALRCLSVWLSHGLSDPGCPTDKNGGGYWRGRVRGLEGAYWIAGGHGTMGQSWVTREQILIIYLSAKQGSRWENDYKTVLVASVGIPMRLQQVHRRWNSICCAMISWWLSEGRDHPAGFRHKYNLGLFIVFLMFSD